MKVLLAGLLLVCLAAARDCKDTPPGKGGPTASTAILPFYKYSFDISKENTKRELHLYMDVDDASTRLNQTLWMRVTADATTAREVDLHVKINLNSQSESSATDWFSGDLSGIGSDNEKTIAATDLGIENNTDRIYFDFYPGSCSSCRESIEFSVETAWLDSTSPRVWGAVEMVDDLRTIVFQEPEGGFVHFYSDFEEGTTLYTSVVFPGTVDQKSEVVLYWNQGAPATKTDNLDKFPIDGVKEGNYLVSRPFTATTTGRYWLGAYVEDSAGVGDPEFTIKVGFNEKPCSGAVSTVASSFLLALIPLTLLFSRM